MELTLAHDEMTFVNMSPDDLAAKGVPAQEIARAIKSKIGGDILVFAEGYRRKLASTSAGKLAEYRFKEEIARDPAATSEAELALIAREAEARGITRDALIGEIRFRAAAYRQTALLIGALEAEAFAAVSSVPDDADNIEERLTGVLAAVKAEAQDQYQQALAMMAGG